MLKGNYFIFCNARLDMCFMAHDGRQRECVYVYMRACACNVSHANRKVLTTFARQMSAQNICWAQ